MIEEIKNDKKTISQIAKMISSGEIPKEVYDKYLSYCPIGFMKYEDLLKYLTNNQPDYKSAWEELTVTLSNYFELCFADTNVQSYMQELEQKYNIKLLETKEVEE